MIIGNFIDSWYYNPDFRLYALNVITAIIYLFDALRHIHALSKGREEKLIRGYKKLDKSNLHLYDIKKAAKIQCVFYVLLAALSLFVFIYSIVSYLSANLYTAFLIAALIIYCLISSPLALYISKKHD